MKREFGDDLYHALMYMKGVVIRLKDEPIVITDVKPAKNKKGGFILRYRDKETGIKGKIKSCNIKHPKLEMLPVPLGFLPTTKDSKWHCTYIQRIPNRTWHVGLCQSNMRQYANENLEYAPGVSMPIASVSFFISDEFNNLVKGKYISPGVAMTLAKEQPARAWAFSRRFMIFKDQVYYKYFRDPVGQVKNWDINLFPEASFLKETLADDTAHNPC